MLPSTSIAATDNLKPVAACADWFAGLIPIYLAARHRPGGVYLGARSVLLIHNLAHQGVYSPKTFVDLGLPGDWYRCALATSGKDGMSACTVLCTHW